MSELHLEKMVHEREGGREGEAEDGEIDEEL